MKILFDQGTAVPLRRWLVSHSVVTTYEKGWSTLKNGDLIQSAEGDGFDVFVTTDRNLKYQQNLRNRSIAVVVLCSTSWPKIKLIAPEVATRIDAIQRGEYIEIAIV